MPNGKWRHRGGPGGRFVQLHHYILNSAAWRDLSSDARSLYVELRKRFNGRNNGTIGLGCREAAEAMNVSRSTANRAFDCLIDHGFIEVAKPSTFHQKKMAREYLLTELRDDRDGSVPTKAFMRWVPRR